VSDGKSYWQNLIAGTGQALPVAVIGALMAFGTLMVNVQIQLSELRLKQDQTLQILERSEQARDKALAWLKEEIEDIEARVDRLEGRRP
tara:strand:+ start:1957 stop:2223 length:267 start_codon:yes stop_codon:yes gene_type:complete